MILDEEQATDEMQEFFRLAWEAVDWPQLGFAEAPPVKWQGTDADKEIPTHVPSATWTAIHSNEEQGSLSDDQGNRRYNTMGMIAVQCFGPMKEGTGFTVAQRMAIIAKKVYRGKRTANCIWFKNVRITEIGLDAGRYIFNMYAEFHYNEVG